MAEIMTGRPFFVGKNSVDQLVEIIKVLGTPTKEQVESMNQQYSDFQFPDIKYQGLDKVHFSNLSTFLHITVSKPCPC